LKGSIADVPCLGSYLPLGVVPFQIEILQEAHHGLWHGSGGLGREILSRQAAAKNLSYPEAQ
jgi:hypothetical protein